MSTAVPILPPPLRDGDRLSREEFLRRWEAMPDLKHAELIDGVVYMPSPVGRKHSAFHSQLAGWLSVYSAATPGCEAGVDCTWLTGDDVPQPDLHLQILPEYGGQSRVEGNLAAGAPELAIEISDSSRARDLGSKLHLYEQSGVREYMVVLLRAKEIVWRELAKSRFRKLAADAEGVWRSHVFPGLWLDPEALWAREMGRVFAVLQQGIATHEHAEFVTQLASQKR